MMKYVGPLRDAAPGSISDPQISTLQDLSMSRQDANAAFARTSFLYGGNADYLENLYARYETDPTSVDAQWQAFFQSLKDERADVMTNARRPAWQRPYPLARNQLPSPPPAHCPQTHTPPPATLQTP